MMYPPPQERSLIHMMIHKRKKRSMQRKKLRISKRAKLSTLSKTRKKSPIRVRGINGVLKAMNPKETFWFRAYVQFPNTSNVIFNYKFRKRFRMPYSQFIWLLSKVSNHPLFKQWKQLRQNTHPISLLLLGSLRYLGRGWCFDDLEKATGISEEVHRFFFINSLNLEYPICIHIL